MSNSVKYENGELTISISVMRKYVQDIVNMVNILRGNVEIKDIESVSLDGVKYDKVKDSVPFRILDGEFVPYVETFMVPYPVKICAEDVPSCTIVKHAYMMRAMIGTLVIDEDVNLATILPGTANIIPKYSIPVIGGAAARPVAQATKGFPKNFHDSLKVGQDTKVLIDKETYGFISITSSKVNWIPLEFDTSSIEQGALEISSKLLQESRSIHEKSYLVKGTYQVTESERDCLNAIAQKSLSDSKGNVKSSIRINFDPETAKEVIEYLSKPSKLSYKIGSNLKVGPSVDVILPPIFANLLSRRLEFETSKFSTGNTIEVALTQEDLPNIAAFIEGTVRDIVNNSTAVVKEALILPCMMYLNLVGDLENEVGQ